MTCPGCGTPTEALVIRTGTGTTMEEEVRPAWCWDCIRARVTAAREYRPCFCSDAHHDHGVAA